MSYGLKSTERKGQYNYICSRMMAKYTLITTNKVVKLANHTQQ